MLCCGGVARRKGEPMGGLCIHIWNEERAIIVHTRKRGNPTMTTNPETKVISHSATRAAEKPHTHHACRAAATVGALRASNGAPA